VLYTKNSGTGNLIVKGELIQRFRRCATSPKIESIHVRIATEVAAGGTAKARSAVVVPDYEPESSFVSKTTISPSLRAFHFWEPKNRLRGSAVSSATTRPIGQQQ
jgi:hypothetical protein